MIGSFLTRGLVMIFGYAYPAYECFKTVEKNKPEIKQLRFWCHYWILVAVLTVCERIGDAFVSWVPMYSEAKLAFFIYLWYPKTMGTTYVYDSFFKPYVSKHETDIDRNLLELRTRAGDLVVLYWQRAASYGQTRIFDILQYVAAQPTPVPRPVPQGARVRSTTSGTTRPAANVTQQQSEEPPSPTSSTSSGQNHEDMEEEEDPREVSKAALPAPAAPVISTQKLATNQLETSTCSAPPETETMQIETGPSVPEKTNLPLKETTMEETLQFTQGNLRRKKLLPNNNSLLKFSIQM